MAWLGVGVRAPELCDRKIGIRRELVYTKRLNENIEGSRPSDSVGRCNQF